MPTREEKRAAAAKRRTKVKPDELYDAPAADDAQLDQMLDQMERERSARPGVAVAIDGTTYNAQSVTFDPGVGSVQQVRAVRCSSLPLLNRCPPSQGSALKVDTSGDEADVGTAAHLSLAHWVETSEIMDPRRAAGEAGAEEEDAAEIDDLATFGRAMWVQLSDAFPSPQCEVSMSTTLGGVKLTGTADVLSIVGDEVRILDWKTGRRHRDYLQQVKGYALLAVLTTGAASASVTVVYVRDRWRETVDFTRAELMAFAEDVGRMVAESAGDRFRVGEHCRTCPRATECPARASWVRSSLADLIDMAGWEPTYAANVLRDMAAKGLLADLYGAVQSLEKAAKIIRGELRADLSDRGPMAQPDGWALELTTQQVRQVDALTGWAVLQQILPTDQQLAQVVNVRLGALEDAVKARAPRGQKQAAADEAIRSLKAAGAITYQTRERMQERVKPKELPAVVGPPDSGLD